MKSNTGRFFCQFVCVRLTGGELLLTEAAVSLLHLNSDATSELDVPVPLPGVHFVLENTHNGLILTPDEVCLIFLVNFI